MGLSQGLFGDGLLLFSYFLWLSFCDRIAASAAPAWMADIYLCVHFFTVCAFDRSFLRLLFARLDVYADAGVEAVSNLFTSPESFPSLWGLLASCDVWVAASLHCWHWGKWPCSGAQGSERAACVWLCRPVGASPMKIKYVNISGSEAGGWRGSGLGVCVCREWGGQAGLKGLKENEIEMSVPQTTR